VAHGQRSGADKAVKFSNTNNSFQSSIGFYITGETYNGQHGRSLRLDGVDDGFNDNARKRAIVVHGADYVSQGTINALGRLGRSQGCPAVAPELANKAIPLKVRPCSLSILVHKTILPNIWTSTWQQHWRKARGRKIQISKPLKLLIL
jgi:hypothetical protein